MQFIDEQNNVLCLHDLFHHDLEAFLELTAVFRSRNERSEIKGDHASVQNIFRNIGADDPLGEPFHDRRFADPGFPDDHGIVLGPA